MNWLSREAGQERRQNLNNALAQFAQYYLGPTGIPQRLNALGILNPVNDMEQASQNALAMTAPGATGRERFNAGVGMVTDMATVVAPAYAASRVGTDGAAAIVDALTGVGAMQRQGLDDAGRRFVADQSGNMRIGSDGPADEIARMLREGRAHEITDDMMGALGPNDQMRLFDLYEQGATGVPMPMDQASRMARAREMGFDTDTNLYHGTASKFDAFDPSHQRDPGFWFTTDRSNAANYAHSDGDLINVYTAPTNKASVPFDDDGYGSLMPKIDGEFSDIEDNVGLILEAQKARDGTVEFPQGNFTESGFTRVEFDPTKIRRTEARFDPRLKHLANLFAGIGGVAILPRDEE